MTALLLALTLCLLAACTPGGPVGSTAYRCVDYPADAPVASRCE